MIRSLTLILLIFTQLPYLKAQPDTRPFEPEMFNEMPYVRDLAMSADGREIFFTVDDYRHTVGFIATSHKKRKKWSSPEVVSFSGKYRDIEPFLSHEGQRLYFASNRPIDPSSAKVKDYDLWFVDRDPDQKGGWLDPVRLDEPVNSEADEYYPSLTRNGDLYFTTAREGSVGTEDIFVAEYADGEFQEPVSVSGGVNSESYEFNAFVAQDASYLIFTSYRLRDGRNRSDLYISRKTTDNEWGPAELLPGIHSNAIDYCPFVDRGGKRLYFTSERNNISPSYAEGLDMEEFIQMIRENPNGLGRIYSVDFQELLKSIGMVE